MPDVFDEIAPDELAERPLSSAVPPAFFSPLPTAPTGDIFDQLAPEPVADELGIGEEVRGFGRALNRGGRSFLQSLDVTAMRQAEPPEALKPSKSLSDAQRDYEAFNTETQTGTNPSDRDAERFRLGMDVVKARHAEYLKDRAEKASKSFAKQAAAIEQLPQTEAQQEFAKKETPWWAFFKNPVELSALTLAESAPQMAATMAAAPTGPMGVAGVAGLTSWNAESSGRIINSIAEDGIDLKDPKAVMGWFADRAKRIPAIAKADLAALGPATFDALTAGLAGSFLGPAMGKGLRPVLTATGKEMGLQMAGGGLGSIAGSTLAGEPIDWKDFVLEVAGELAPGEAISNVRAARRSSGAAPAFFQPAPTPPIEPPATTREDQNAISIQSPSSQVLRTQAPESQEQVGLQGLGTRDAQPEIPAAAQTEVQSTSGNVPAAQVLEVIQALPAIEPEVARQKLWQNMQGREMDIPADQWLQPASPHLKLVLGANAPSWRDLNFSGVVTASANPDGSYRVKVIPRTPEQVTPSSEPRATAAAEQPTNIPVSGVPNAPPPVKEFLIVDPRDFDNLPEPRVFYDYHVKKYTATKFDDKFGNMHGTGETPELAVAELNNHIDAARKHGTWRSVNHPTEPVRAKNAQTEISPTTTAKPVLGGSEANLPSQQREQSRRNNEAQAEQMRAELEAMGVTVPESKPVRAENAQTEPSVVPTVDPSEVSPVPRVGPKERTLIVDPKTGKTRRLLPVEQEFLDAHGMTIQEAISKGSIRPVKETSRSGKERIVGYEPNLADSVQFTSANEAMAKQKELRATADAKITPDEKLRESVWSAMTDSERRLVRQDPRIFDLPNGALDWGVLRPYAEKQGKSVVKESLTTEPSPVPTVETPAEFSPPPKKPTLAPPVAPVEEMATLPVESPEELQRQLREELDGPVSRAIAKIEDLQKRLRGSGSDVSMGVPKAILDLALEAARLALKAGKTIAQAIDAAIAKIRESIATFTEADEAVVRSTLEWELTQEPEASETPQRDTVIDPATGRRVPDAEGGSDIVNIAGQEFNIMGKDRMTPEQKAAAAGRVQNYFRNELGLPGEADTSVGTRRGSTDTNVVFKIQPDGENHDAAGEKLLAHLTEQIQMQHQPGGNPAYVSMLVNAINKNFNTGDLGRVLSPGMLDRLMNISVGESSWRGSMLRAITGITDDMVTVARNPMFFLRRTYENMFGGDLVRKIMDRIANNFGESFTGDEIERLYNANPKLQELFNKVVDRLKVKPSLKEVIQEIFATRVDRQDDIVQKFVDTMVNKFSATPEEAAKLKAEFGSTFVKSFEAARVKAQAKALATLLPEERAVIGPGTPLYKKLTDLVNSGWFNSAKVVEEYARSKGMVIPTSAEVERMRQWSIKEQSLKEPTLEEIASSDADEAKAAAKVSAVTLETRQDLLRKMNTLWSRWTHPIVSLRHPLEYFTDPVKRRNTVMATNEWLTANLLLKLGFGSRQLLDVGTQMLLHTPTRAAQYAFEQWSNDKSAGRDSNLLDNLSQAITDAYRTRLKVLGDTLASFGRTLRGRGEQKNVEQLLSSIAVFDRALLTADEMKAAGKPAAARFLHLLALTLRFGRQFAAAADVIQGVPAEAQEMAHQIRTGLREQAKSKAQQDLEFDTILGLLTTARVEAIAEARQILELRGLDTSKTSVQRAAWHILREKIYDMAKNAGLPADEWKAQNHYYRNVIGWNEPETQGLGRGNLGGPGGFVALTAKAGKELATMAGVPAFPFVFGNAMGIALNRKLAYTPLGFFPGFFKGSPWFEGERNIRQRKIEAVIGTTIGSTLFTLVALGIWTVLPAFWPKDDKERAKWTANGWQPGMLIVPVSDTHEQKIGTRVGAMALLSPYLAAGGALHDANVARAKKQEDLNQQAAKLGLTPQKVGPLDAGQWLNVVGAAAYSSATGGRTASGMLGSYTDFGNFSAKKSGAAATSTLIPGLPGYQELARMAGANINPKLASFWDLLVPLPTSDANRVNLLGDPMRNENDIERIFQVLSGGTAPFPTSSDQFQKNKAYANLFASDFRPPPINPTRGYQFGNEIRPMTETELQRYTTARGKNFASGLQSVDVNGLAPDEAKKVVQQAFQRANASALESVGATPTARAGAAAISSQPAAPGVSAPPPRRTPTGNLRASLSRRIRTPALGRVRSRVGQTRLATMRVPRLRRSRLRASLSRPLRGRFSVRSRMATARRLRASYA